jgi:DNA repair exonuclease SbcCD nuclease subunit
VRLVHLSDLHLGFRQYQRLTPTGVNQREADVARSFVRAVDLVIARRPDVVVIAGDVFHSVRPSNPAILHAFRQFGRLRAALPGVPVVMVAGNHDAPKTAETGCILRLFGEVGVTVVDQEPQRLTFAEQELSVLAVPDVPGVARPELAPDPTARWNVLLLHGEVAGVLPREATPVDRAAIEIPREALRAPEWDYVALGHYHVYREVAPNAFYSGSIDYTSANAWGELKEERAAGLAGKGIVERDLASGAHRFLPLEPVRALVDLPAVEARNLTARELDAAIRASVDGAPGGIAERVVRLVVRDVPRHVSRELDHRALREIRRRALHFHLDLRRPEVQRRDAAGAPMRRPSLPDIVREKLRTRELPSDVDREALVALGLRYLGEADAVVQAQAAGMAAGAAEGM